MADDEENAVDRLYRCRCGRAQPCRHHGIEELMTAITLHLRPVSLREARAFIGTHHRHNLPPRGWKFGVGVEVEGELVGVAVASRPVARALDDGQTVEVVRSCTDGTKNVNSKLYGAICRAAAALGYRRVVTYTLASEPGSSLKAVGFTPEAELPVRGGWDTPSRPRVEVDLFGEERTPTEAKVRWVREVAA
jgi:hypothetical protein